MTIDYRTLATAGIVRKTGYFRRNTGGLTRTEQSSFIADINYISENLGNYTEDDLRQPMNSLLKRGENKLAAIIYAIGRIEKNILKYPQHILGIQEIMANEFQDKYLQVYPYLMQNLAYKINGKQLKEMYDTPDAIMGLYYYSIEVKNDMLMSAYFESITHCQEYSSLERADQKFLQKLLDYGNRLENTSHDFIRGMTIRNLNRSYYKNLPENDKFKINILQNLNITNESIASQLAIPEEILEFSPSNPNLFSAMHDDKKRLYQSVKAETYNKLIASDLSQYKGNSDVYLKLYDYAEEFLDEDAQTTILSAYGKSINHQYTKENLQHFSKYPHAISVLYMYEQEHGANPETLDKLSAIHEELMPSKMKKLLGKGSNIYNFLMQHSIKELADIIESEEFEKHSDNAVDLTHPGSESLEEDFAKFLPPELSSKMIDVTDEIEKETDIYQDIKNAIKKFVQQFLSYIFGSERGHEDIKKDLKEVFKYLQEQQEQNVTVSKQLDAKDKNRQTKKETPKKTTKIRKKNFTEKAIKGSRKSQKLSQKTKKTFAKKVTEPIKKTYKGR